MLNKLRRKFILINMVIVTLVLLVSFTTIIVVNDSQHVTQVQSALESATTIRNYGPFSSGSAPTGAQPTDDGASTSQTDQATGGSTVDSSTTSSTTSDTAMTTHQQDSTSSSSTTPTTHNGDKPDMSQLVATSSYVIDPDTETVTATINQGVTISDSDLQTAVQYALNSGQDNGEISDLGLYYKISDDGTSEVIAFASSSYITQSRTYLLSALGIVGLCSLAVFFIISLFLARWALKPVERSWNQQQQFIADASHELKTPLTVMRANNSIILNHTDETVESQIQWIESNETEIQTMQTLVGDMLFLARPDSQQQPVRYGSVNLSSLVESIALQFESIAYERHLDFDSDVTENLTIEGDESRLRRLFGVLVDNALKYADEGGHVRISLKKDDSHAILRVNNTGEVISEEDIPHIFDRFYRADKARTRDVGGYGLGLAIAKEVCEEHGGSIEASSNRQNGTTFTVRLPLK